MSTKDAKHTAAMVAAGAVALSLASSTALAEPQTRNADTERPSMTRSAQGPATKASTSEFDRLSMSRSAATSADRAAEADVGKQLPTRSAEAPETKASTPEGSRLSTGRSTVAFAERASKTEIGKQHSARSAEKATAKSAGSDTVKQATARSVENPVAKAAGPDVSKQGTVRSDMPFLRAPAPERVHRQQLAMRSERPTAKNAPQAPVERKAIRTARASWWDWLFGR